uniref:Uncharacterized protein n=1 Tax=Avena sativa TaxID=4498 RepID=A0ACD6AHF2_AVESA
MPHEKPVRYGALGGDVDDMNMAWKREKRRRKHLSSSSDAPTATSQGHQAPISDMAIVQAQDHAMLPRIDSGEEKERTQDLFGPHVILSEEDQASYAQKLLPNIRPPIEMMSTISWMDNFKVQVRQGRYRIAYYKAMNPRCELKHPDAYSEDEICDQEYFKHLQEDENFEWFFHTDDSWIPDLEDYQRIVLKNLMPGSFGPEYLDIDGYRELYHTYEMDDVYVKYYGEISKKIKWIGDFLHMDTRSEECRDMETRGWRQALRIATQLPHMTVRLASFAYNEYILELREDTSLKDLDLVFFEIWRLVVKDNKDYMDAMKEVSGMDKFRRHKRIMNAELKASPVFCTMKQRINWITRERGIDLNTEDDKARDLFRKGVARFKKKNMVKYAEKRMEIGELLNLHKRIEVPGRIED